MLGVLDSVPSTIDTKNKEFWWKKDVLYRPRLENSLAHANPVT